MYVHGTSRRSANASQGKEGLAADHFILSLSYLPSVPFLGIHPLVPQSFLLSIEPS